LGLSACDEVLRRLRKKVSSSNKGVICEELHWFGHDVACLGVVRPLGASFVLPPLRFSLQFVWLWIMRRM
jgi:hypothetical protein